MLLFQPGDRFLPVSITGYRCWLLCEYCKGRWLRGMVPAETPEKLEKLVERKAHRLTGILVSGGFTRDGRLPYKPFTRSLQRIRKRYPHLILSMHPGFIGSIREAELLAQLIDYADYEVPLTRRQLELMRLPWRTPEDYILDAAMASDAGLRIAPHILLGLPGAPLEEELENLELLLRHLKPHVLVVLYYTEAESDAAKAMHEIEVVVRRARGRVQSVALGCMRPLWLRRLDYRLLHLFDRIASPSPSLARLLGVKPLPYCCAVPLDALVRRGALNALGQHR